MRINLKTFFDNYIVHPFSKELRPIEKTVAALSSGVFLVLALGSLHRRAWRHEKKIEEKPQDLRTKTLVDESLGSTSEEVIQESIQPTEPMERKKPLSSQQQTFFDSLSTPVEKDLYETLHKIEGAFADLVLLIVKGRTVDFKTDGNKVILNLKEGPVACKLLGFELKVKLPKQLTLLHFPEKNKITFVQKIPFNYNGVYILTPETATLSNQGVRLQADLSWTTKLSGRAKFLEAPLSSPEVFKLFS